jgi:hypothetical protein
MLYSQEMVLEMIERDDIYFSKRKLFVTVSLEVLIFSENINDEQNLTSADLNFPIINSSGCHSFDTFPVSLLCTFLILSSNKNIKSLH